MRIDVITAFPVIFESPLQTALLGKAVAGGPLEVLIHDLRTWATDAHRTVDDEPFGGGPGMVLKPEPIFAAVESLDPDRGRVVLMSPAGRTLHQAFVRELSAEPHLTLVCGRYWTMASTVVETPSLVDVDRRRITASAAAEAGVTTSGADAGPPDRVSPIHSCWATTPPRNS